MRKRCRLRGCSPQTLWSSNVSKLHIAKANKRHAWIWSNINAWTSHLPQANRDPHDLIFTSADVMKVLQSTKLPCRCWPPGISLALPTISAISANPSSCRPTMEDNPSCFGLLCVQPRHIYLLSWFGKPFHSLTLKSCKYIRNWISIKFLLSMISSHITIYNLYCHFMPFWSVLKHVSV